MSRFHLFLVAFLCYSVSEVASYNNLTVEGVHALCKVLQQLKGVPSYIDNVEKTVRKDVESCEEAVAKSEASFQVVESIIAELENDTGLEELFKSIEDERLKASGAADDAVLGLRQFQRSENEVVHVITLYKNYVMKKIEGKKEYANDPKVREAAKDCTETDYSVTVASLGEALKEFIDLSPSDYDTAIEKDVNLTISHIEFLESIAKRISEDVNEAVTAAANVERGRIELEKKSNLSPSRTDENGVGSAMGRPLLRLAWVLGLPAIL
ncbi:putative Glutamic acid alanine rich protein of Trypanosoma [Trypanosoma vivax]|uniref:Trypanosoma glutamic acid/alanine-rich protein domain-containing protein n=1 Tax=Trypanosoma vivax (strain Y486) TaxID=1055687 RepID=F9WN13_TRYVY|nr:putative Glutamic acid alanine rich protein of Trypanosoma [Trypanosoma vivax]KAH8613805.1 putative Glutamic acid alanine rich protein of Trypanosoma [Trypanosoma vivax]CCD18927.1 hypothetical protein, conserved [Trypanosoma vivax Y486]|eukprot:CCD18927.1 hypothetical protein, conserved [Trypanosoma vivax Y486]